MTKSKIFLFLLLTFVAGITVRSFLEVPIVFIWIGILVSVTAVAIGIFQEQKIVIVYGFLAVAFFIGILRFGQVEQARPDLAVFYGQPFFLQGIIWEEPERTQTLQRLKMRVAEVDGRIIDPQFYTLITTRRYPEYALGDELSFRGVFEEPKNFGEFDYASYLSRQDIYGIVSFPIIEKTGTGKGSKLRLALSKIKHAFEENIDRALPEPHAAFLKGLTFGERESLPKELVENFNRTGTTHIVALSGYNITMIGRFFIWGLLFLTIPFRFSFWIATSMIILFVLLTGASPSVVRAGIMGILVLIAQREGRAYHMTNALAFAAVVMIFHNPKILRFDAAFQLSFLATVGLIFLSPQVERWFDTICFRLSLVRTRLSLEQERYKLAIQAKYKLFQLKRIFIETLSAQLMVLPLIIYLFGRVSLVSPLSNILVLIAVPYSMVLGFLTGFLGFLWGPLSQISGWINWALLEYKIRIIELFAGIPGASLQLGDRMAMPIFALYIFIFWKLWKQLKRT